MRPLIICKAVFQSFPWHGRRAQQVPLSSQLKKTLRIWLILSDERVHLDTAWKLFKWQFQGQLYTPARGVTQNHCQEKEERAL